MVTLSTPSRADLRLLKKIPCIAVCGIFVFRSWDAFSDANEPASPGRDGAADANTYSYFAGDPESGGHPIGRRSIASEDRLCLRCRSWSSAR